MSTEVAHIIRVIQHGVLPRLSVLFSFFNLRSSFETSEYTRPPMRSLLKSNFTVTIHFPISVARIQFEVVLISGFQFFSSG